MVQYVETIFWLRKELKESQSLFVRLSLHHSDSDSDLQAFNFKQYLSSLYIHVHVGYVADLRGGIQRQSYPS